MVDLTTSKSFNTVLDDAPMEASKTTRNFLAWMIGWWEIYKGCLKSNFQYLRKGVKNGAKNFEKIYLKGDIVDYFAT